MTRKYRYMEDGDDARDLAFDYEHDYDAQYEDYRTECYEMGEVPKPR